MIRSYVLTALVAVAAWGSAMAAPVSHVSVQVESVETPMPPLVHKRIAASLQTVGNHVFLNHDETEIQAGLSSYERTVNDIINRVLIGYTVEDISVKPGTDTVLSVHLRPWGETIRTVRTTLDYGSLPQMGIDMTAQDLSGVNSLVESLLTGLPVDALDWANGTVQSVMESEIEAMLPEFYPHITIVPGTTAEVHIYFMPKLPVVRNVNINVDADNLPKIIFLHARKNLEQHYAGLEGLPVAFVRRHENLLTADIQQQVQNQWVVRQYKLHVIPTLNIGENCKINLRSETDFYDIRAGVYLDMDRDKDPDDANKKDNTVLTAHVGRKLGHHEFFGEVEFKTASVDWNWKPGYFYRWDKSTTLGYQFETEDHSHHLWWRQRLGDYWQLRFDRDLTNRKNEIGLSYRVHEYVSLEYIVSDHDNWLRVIGYL